MAIKKNDFIEIEFTGKIKGTGEIFDTNIKVDAPTTNDQRPTTELKPFILSVGHKMLPNGFDADLEGKDTEKSYTLDLKPEDAF